ncbi:MAG TPA: hypothetical protein V6C85_35375 [Allocoleopsis sp.]
MTRCINAIALPQPSIYWCDRTSTTIFLSCMKLTAVNKSLDNQQAAGMMLSQCQVSES